MAIIDELTVLDAPMGVDVIEGFRLVGGEFFGRHLPQRARVFSAMAEPALEVFAVEKGGAEADEGSDG